MSNHLFDGLLAQAERERPFADLTDGRQYRYQDLFEISARFANLLVARGVRPGDRVAVQVPKSIEALMLYLATLRAGAVFLPLNTAYTAAEIEYFLGDAEPALFVCAPESRASCQSMVAKHGIALETLGVWQDADSAAGSWLEGAEQQPATFDNVARTSDDLAAILYTSGTTGRAKGAMLSHDNLLSNAIALAECWQFSGDDILLHALPIFHTHGLFVASNVTMISGASLIFLNAFSTDKVIEHLPRSTSLMGVPTFYTRLLGDERFTRELVAHIRLFVSGSAPLLAETHVEFEQRCGHRILERYGMTETSMNTSNPYSGERRAGTVGFALPGVEVRVVDPVSLEPMAQGSTGSIEVRGPNVFKGYWQQPEKTRAEFRDDGFFITGDLGMIDEQGYLCIVGRAKDLIISGGFNVYPKEVELVLDEQPGVLESAVIGVPHPDFGEAVVGVIVAQPDSQPQESALIEALGQQIARFKQPKKLVFVDELPRNTMGKVQKNSLRETYAALFKSA